MNAKESELEFNYQKFVPEYCPKCGGEDLEHIGYWHPSDIQLSRMPAMLNCAECGRVQAATFIVEDNYPAERHGFEATYNE